MTIEQERVVVQRAKSGDLNAFEVIVRDSEALLYNLALRTMHFPEDAADVVQETYIKAYTGIGGFRGDSRLTVWLCRILHHVCVDALRKRKDTVSLSRDGTEQGLAEADIPDERFDPAALLERKDLSERVRAALDQLPEEFRTPLLLREYAEMSYEEIGKVLSINMGTVKTRIFRARKKLCSLLTKDGNFSGENPSKPGKGGFRV